MAGEYTHGCTCHTEAGTDLSSEHRLQPFLFLLISAKHVEHLHISCVCGGTTSNSLRQSWATTGKCFFKHINQTDLSHPKTKQIPYKVNLGDFCVLNQVTKLKVYGCYNNNKDEMWTFGDDLKDLGRKNGIYVLYTKVQAHVGCTVPHCIFHDLYSNLKIWHHVGCLPGAWQLKTSGAKRQRPVSSAM